MTKTVIFKAEETIQITGIQHETECSHCGRALKVGIRVANFSGAYGADCLAKAFACYTYNGKKYRHGADTIKERGIIAHKGIECMTRNGMSSHHFLFKLQSDLCSI